MITLDVTVLISAIFWSNLKFLQVKIPLRDKQSNLDVLDIALYSQRINLDFNV